MSSSGSSTSSEESTSEAPNHMLKEVLPMIVRLDSAGLRFAVWERQIKMMIRQVTGLGCDYLDRPSSTPPHPRHDHLIFCMILWSISEELQITIDVNGTAREAFQHLKINLDPVAFSAQLPIVPSSPDSPCLSNMPLEILNRIIHYVHLLAPSEASDINARKEDASKHVYNRVGKRWYACKTKPNPVLNSLQSLGSVNRKFHQLCCGRLWQHLSFPSSAPGPVSRWTKSILLKHRNLVKSVFIGLVTDWFRLGNGSNNDLDNLRTRDDDEWEHRGLSYKNTVKILAMCPNVRSIEFHLIDVDEEEDPIPAEGLDLVYGRLESIVVRLPALRRLVLTRGYDEPASDEYVTRLIKHLPLLECLECGHLTRSRNRQRTDTFVWHLTQLKHLSQLSLQYCDAVDATWSSESWPQIITKLTFIACKNLSATIAQHLILSMAPNLIQLDLELHHEEVVFDRPGAELRVFNLPALRGLKILDRFSAISPENFTQSRKLEDIKCMGMTVPQCIKAQDLICASTWPQLQSFDMEYPVNRHDANWDYIGAVLKLRDFCETAGIELVHSSL